MEVVNVTVVDTPEVVAVNVAVGSGTVVNSDLTYSATVNSGQTLMLPDTPWIDSDGTPMTTPATLPIVCTPPVTLGVDIVNSDLTLNDHANDGDTYVVADTIVKNTLGTTILTQPSATNTGVIADSVVTNSDNTFSQNVPAETNLVLADVPNVDSDGSTVMTPAQIPFVATPQITPEGWYPPADWGWDAASALITDSDNGFVALYMAYPNIDNYISLISYFSGTAVIDWGDGSASESLQSGWKINHVLDYANIPGGVKQSVGCKLAVIKVNSTSSFTGLLLHDPHPSLGSYYGQSFWLALKLRTDTSFFFRPTDSYGYRAELLKILDFGNCQLNQDSYAAFQRLRGLAKITWNGFAQAVGMCTNGLFSYANLSAFDLSGINWSYYTNWSSCFETTTASKNGVFDAAIDQATTLYSAFTASSAFHTVKFRNTGNVTSINYTLYQAFVTDFEMDNCANVTNTSSFVYPVAGHHILRRLILTGLRVGIDIRNGKLSASAINAFLTSLGTANGAQTINLAGNPGALTCDVSIGTAKGYTIITA